MVYHLGKAPTTLRKPFKRPSFKAAAPALAAASQSTTGASQQSQALADERTREKGKGRARDSGVGLVEQVAGESKAARAWTVQWREPQARKNKSWEEDGYVIYSNGKASLKSDQFKSLGSSELNDGFWTKDEFKIAGKECRVDSEVTMKEWYRLLNGGEAAAEEETIDTPTPKYIPKPKPIAVAPRPKQETPKLKAYVPPTRKPAIVVVESDQEKESDVENSKEKEKEVERVEREDEELDENSEVEVEVHKKKEKKRTKERTIETVEEMEVENSPPKKRRRQDSATKETEGLAWLEERRRKRSIESNASALSRVNSREKATTPIRAPLLSSRKTSRSTQTPGLALSDVKPDISKILVGGDPESESPPSPSPRARPPSQVDALFTEPTPSPPRQSPQQSSPPREESQPEPSRPEPEASTSRIEGQKVEEEDLAGVNWNDSFGSDPLEDDQLPGNQLDSDPMEEDLLEDALKAPSGSEEEGGEEEEMEMEAEEEQVLLEDVLDAPPGSEEEGGDEDAEIEMEIEVEEEDELLDIIEVIPISSRKELVMVDMKGKGRASSIDEVEVVKPRGGSLRYTCMHRAYKKKTWDDDGILVVTNRQAVLRDRETGKEITSGTVKSTATFEEGDVLSIGNKEVQIEELMDEADYSSGAIFNQGPTIEITKFKLPAVTPFKNPNLLAPAKPRIGKALFDPVAEGAIVMKRPDAAHVACFNKKDHAIVDVVIDPVLSKMLRPHQVKGVEFMYERVMGMGPTGQGCILADEMGLGKTLQAITLIWTLLRQNPYSTGTGVISRAVIVCPVTLLKNWSSEIKKWLGNRITVFTADGKNSVQTFCNARNYQVLIIGYEMLNTVIDTVRVCQPPIDLIICDEGHRLKSAATKTAKSVRLFSTARRVILSGTPIQNELADYHSIVDFINPGMLKTYASFKTRYENVILKSREPRANKKQKAAGAERLEELTSLSKEFILRRDGSVIAQYLPTKMEYIVFVVPTQIQIDLYEAIISGGAIANLLDDDPRQPGGTSPLVLMDGLRKLCNSAGLLKRQSDTKRDDGSTSALLNPAVLELLPRYLDQNDFAHSGKFLALGSLLETLRRLNSEKIVVVSNFTSTLDIIEAHCVKLHYAFCRLDGKTKQEDRMPIVDSFNTGPLSKHFVFLLSSKSGGTGINLIGASRLVLIDSDWNPSVDLQAMARIHRQGQTKPCVIYRFLTTGTMDEKIFQRQVTKVGLSASLMDDTETAQMSAKSNAFTIDELRNVFALHTGTPCQTHDLLDCTCQLDDAQIATRNEAKQAERGDDSSSQPGPPQTGFTSASQYQHPPPTRTISRGSEADREKLSLLKEWAHYNCSDLSQVDQIGDPVLRQIIFTRTADAPSQEEGHLVEDSAVRLRGGNISFAFSKTG